METQENTVIVEEAIPETLSTDREPVKTPKKIKKLPNGFKDPLSERGYTFEVHGFAYKVDKVLNRMRRVVVLMGVVRYNQAGEAELLPIDSDMGVDPLSTAGFTWHIKDIAYKVNNALKREKRTVKCMGQAVY